MLLFLAFSGALAAEPDHVFTQKIDHTNDSVGTFDQYYYEYSTFFDPSNGAVILKLGSEVDYLDESGVSDWMHDLAEHFHAVVFTIQHRYYGKSLPFSELSVENLRYLSVEQALNDYAYFHDKKMDVFSFQQNRFRFVNGFNTNLAPDAVYFLLNIWKQLAFDNRRDELHLVGELPDKDSLIQELHSFVQNVYVINPRAEFNRAPITDIKGLPYDLITYYMKN